MNLLIEHQDDELKRFEKNLNKINSNDEKNTSP
jgi:hypothetical protein